MSTGRYRRLLGRRANEVDVEMQMHFDMLVEDLIARGKTPAEARRAALTRLGDLRKHRSEAHHSLLRTRAVCLLANVENSRAHLFYRMCGFRLRNVYDTIFLHLD